MPRHCDPGFPLRYSAVLCISILDLLCQSVQFDALRGVAFLAVRCVHCLSLRSDTILALLFAALRSDAVRCHA